MYGVGQRDPYALNFGMEQSGYASAFGAPKADFSVAAPAAAPATTAVGMTTAQRPPMMMQQGAPQDGARPMTSVNAAGFNSDPTTRVGQQFDPGNIASQSRGPAPALQKKSESSTEEKLKEMERQVNGLIEESAFEAAKGDSGSPAALEKAKEAAKKERVLCKQREVSPCRRGVAVLFVFAR
jgi:hypothetical protein